MSQHKPGPARSARPRPRSATKRTPARAPVSHTERTTSYNTAVGDMTHELIATIAARDPRDDVATLLAEISSLAPALACRQSGLGSRTRAATLVAMTSAATYVRRFLPPPTCRLIGTEMPVEGGRVDLVWGTGADGIIYDEVKLASGAGSHMVDGAALQQVLRYATAGRARHGDAFLGVRLLLLGAPRSSLFFDPAGRQQLLSGTRFQFDIPVEVTR